MTVQLDWPPELVARLTEEARRQGLSLEALLLQAVEQLPQPQSRQSEKLARQEAGRRIRELRKGNVLGADLTVRDLVEEGRRF